MVARVFVSLLVAVATFFGATVLVYAVSSADVQSEMGAGGLELMLKAVESMAAGVVAALVAFVLTMVAWPAKKRDSTRLTPP